MRVVISEFIQGFLIHKIFDKKLYLAAYAFCSKCPSTDDYMPAPSIKLKKKKRFKTSSRTNALAEMGQAELTSAVQWRNLSASSKRDLCSLWYLPGHVCIDQDASVYDKLGIYHSLVAIEVDIFPYIF